MIERREKAYNRLDSYKVRNRIFTEMKAYIIPNTDKQGHDPDRIALHKNLLPH